MSIQIMLTLMRGGGATLVDVTSLISNYAIKLSDLDGLGFIPENTAVYGWAQLIVQTTTTSGADSIQSVFLGFMRAEAGIYRMRTVSSSSTSGSFYFTVATLASGTYELTNPQSIGINNDYTANTSFSIGGNVSKAVLIKFPTGFNLT